MKTYQVVLAPDFLSDLFELYRYVALRGGKERARDLEKKLEKAARQLKNFPDRGHALPELAPMGIQDIQEITNGPYRIIYKVLDNAVHILACIDGRRDVEQVLIQRAVRV
jgi:plasmid stabilization system protein ParE